jgi:hypothetical protein
MARSTAQLSFVSDGKPIPAGAIADGRCCSRCGLWHPPETGGRFGLCQTLFVTVERIPGVIEKGIVLSLDEASNQGVEWVLSNLSTGAGFSCASFVERSGATTA